MSISFLKFYLYVFKKIMLQLGNNNENENEDEADEEDFSSELNELIANSSNSRNERREDNSRMSSASAVNRCLNDCEASATSSICQFDSSLSIKFSIFFT